MGSERIRVYRGGTVGAGYTDGTLIWDSQNDGSGQANSSGVFQENVPINGTRFPGPYPEAETITVTAQDGTKPESAHALPADGGAGAGALTVTEPPQVTIDSGFPVGVGGEWNTLDADGHMHKNHIAVSTSGASTLIAVLSAQEDTGTARATVSRFGWSTVGEADASAPTNGGTWEKLGENSVYDGNPALEIWKCVCTGAVSGYVTSTYATNCRHRSIILYSLQNVNASPMGAVGTFMDDGTPAVTVTTGNIEAAGSLVLGGLTGGFNTTWTAAAGSVCAGVGEGAAYIHRSSVTTAGNVGSPVSLGLTNTFGDSAWAYIMEIKAT